MQSVNEQTESKRPEKEKVKVIAEGMKLLII